MKFDDYVSRKEIILQLCRIRAKCAHQRNKQHLVHLLSSDDKSNYHVNTKEQNLKKSCDVQILDEILPPRRKWKKVIKELRYKGEQRINTVDYNVLSLQKTIEYYEKHNPSENFLVNLNKFIDEIQRSFIDSNYKISPPVIIPKLKGNVNMNGENKCRPISLFNLKDRIIISITNRFFTDLFDSYFLPCSFAFRAVRKDEDGKKIFTTHQNSIQAILDYRKKFSGEELWVSECDISKFYDSVHHSVAKKYFNKLMMKVKKDKPESYDKRPESVFYKFLDCYSFVKNVLPYNEPSNWKWDKIPNGKFGWIEKELKNLKYYKNVRRTRIGVPQGGALSGLIANIILNHADEKIRKLKDNALFYARFCDDMVLIHSEKLNCETAYDTYFNTLSLLHLVPHQNNSKPLHYVKDSFWNEETKSKYPYKWSDKEPDNMPWFGFVGYEIHFSGGLRVRKRSLVKEKQKQKEVVTTIIKATKNGKRKSDDTIFESVANRLIGMSVGRVTMKNYKTVKNEMCWANGFSKLKNNKHLRAQLKDLDRNRARQLSRLKKYLDKNKATTTIKTIIPTIRKNAFAIISGLSIKDSHNIREQLVTNGILNNKYKINSSIDIKNPNIKLGLTGKHVPFNDSILYVLQNPKDDSRQVNYYGKPFSYYYQIIERRK